MEDLVLAYMSRAATAVGDEPVPGSAAACTRSSGARPRSIRGPAAASISAAPAAPPADTATLARYQAEGEAAFEPRSKRPKTSPNAISEEIADLIVRLRKDLAGQRLDGAALPV